MKLCTTSVINGLDNKPHFAVVQVGPSAWPMLLGGLADGPNAKESKAEIEFFAKAPVMFDMLGLLATEFSEIDPAVPLTQSQMAALATLVERSARLVHVLKVKPCAA